MITCAPAFTDTFKCPTKWELWRQIISLLPRGRAWQTHEDGAEFIVASESSQLGIYELGSTGLGTEPIVERLTVLQQFWAAFAEVLEYFHARACALLSEFFCSTVVETLPEWSREYGFPDPCEPFDTLCDKVVAQGGATCAYLQSLAARLGFFIECTDCDPDRERLEMGCGEMGLAQLCGCEFNVIYIRMVAPPIEADPTAPYEMGAFRMGVGCADPCPPVPDQLICLIERFKPAHVKAIYINDINEPESGDED